MSCVFRFLRGLSLDSWHRLDDHLDGGFARPVGSMKVDAQYTPQHTDFGFDCRQFWVSYISWGSEIFAFLILNLVVQISGCLKFGDLYFSGFAFWRSKIWDCTILDGLHFSHCQFWIWICRLMAVYNLGFYNFGGSTFLDLVVQISGGLESGGLHFSGV